MIVCNSLSGNYNIYVAKYKENLMNNYTIKMNDIEDVSMTIKDGTLTNVSILLL